MTGPSAATAPAAPARGRSDGVAKLAVPDAGPVPARAYAVAVVLVAAGLCLGAIGVNVLVDPRDEFGTGFYRPLVVDWVHEGVASYRALETPPEDLVVGASRAGMVAGFPGREDTTFTFFAAGSPPPDWLDEYRFVKRSQGPPETLVLIVDQSAFTGVFTPRVPRSAAAEAVLGQPAAWGESAATALQSLAVPYLRDSLHSLELRHVDGYPPAPSAEANPAFGPPDLLERWRNGTFDPSQVDPAIEAQSRRAFGPGHLEVPAYRQSLDALLEEAVADGVDVWAILPPYQPVALADLEERYPAFAEQRADVRAALAAHCPAIHVADATRVEDVGVDPAEFFDQSHLTARGSAQLMAGVLAGRADVCAATGRPTA